MHAIDLLPEMLVGAKVKFLPRVLRTPGIEAGIRKGELGRVQGFALGSADRSETPVLVIECNNGTVEIWLNEVAVPAFRAMSALECNFEGGVVERRPVANYSRDKSDLGLLGKVGK